jgi:hypothetical protein
MLGNFASPRNCLDTALENFIEHFTTPAASGCIVVGRRSPQGIRSPMFGGISRIRYVYE